MSWRDYRNAVVREIHSSHASAIQEPDSIPVYYKIYKKQGEVLTEEWTGTAPGCYAPLEPEFDLVYEGNGKKISELVVNTPGAGGCFGTVSKNLTVTDLELVHPVITAADNAGGLVGCGRKETDAPSLEISVENVLVQYPVITSKGGGTVLEPADAGALVGAFRGTALTVKSVMAANTYRSGVTEPSSVDQTRPDQAEAFKIEAKAGAAGGLIGSAIGNVTLSGCGIGLCGGAVLCRRTRRKGEYTGQWGCAGSDPELLCGRAYRKPGMPDGAVSGDRGLQHGKGTL